MPLLTEWFLFVKRFVLRFPNLPFEHSVSQSLQESNLNAVANFQRKYKKISMRIFGINLFSLFSSKFCRGDHESEIWNWLIITQKVVSWHLYTQWSFILYFGDVIEFILLGGNWVTFLVLKLLFLLASLQIISDSTALL